MIEAAETETETVAVSQLPEFNISQIWYTKVYEPAGVPGATSTSVPERVIPALVEDTKVVVTCEARTGTPLRVSLTSTLVKAVPPVKPFTTAPVSSLAMIEAAETETVTIAVAQLQVAEVPQIW